MRSTTDTYTGKRFRYNLPDDLTSYEVGGIVVPARSTERTSTHLHPDRVPLDLLAKLNPGRTFVKCSNGCGATVEVLHEHETETGVTCTDCFERLTVAPGDLRHER